MIHACIKCRELSFTCSMNGVSLKICNPKTIAFPVFGTQFHFAAAALAMCGSTYSSEQPFSNMNNIKASQRSWLTDENLNACMKLNLTQCHVDCSREVTPCSGCIYGECDYGGCDYGECDYGDYCYIITLYYHQRSRYTITREEVSRSYVDTISWIRRSMVERL